MSGLRQIEFYGNGGIGKSATSQNTSAALVDLGQQILFVGCELKTDSSRPILNSTAQDTVLHLAARGSSGKDLELETRSKLAAKASNAWRPVALTQKSAAPPAKPLRPVAGAFAAEGVEPVTSFSYGRPGWRLCCGAIPTTAEDHHVR